MAIISAGVIMNAIFAVVFATIAYKMGVEERPAGVGAVTPGDSAWQAGMEPGDRIVAFGNSADYDHLRHEDLMRNVILNGKNKDLAIKVHDARGREKTYQVVPVLREGNKFPTVGLLGLSSTTFAVPTAKDVEKYQLARQMPITDQPLKSEDRVIAVDGHAINSGAEFDALLAQKPRGPLKLTVERTEKLPTGADPKQEPTKTKHEITLQEKPNFDLGVILEMGPVKAIRKGSPAETAGLLVGDRIETIDGEPVGDPLTLGQRLLDRVGQSIKIQVSRMDKEGKPVAKELSATLESPRNLFPINRYDVGGFAAAEPLGAAFELLPTVADVVPGSPAAAKKIQKGDQLLSATFEQPKRAKADKYDEMVSELKPFDLTKKPNHWLKVMALAQAVKPDVTVKLEFKRGATTLSAPLAAVASESHFDESRGLDMKGEIRNHVAKNWSEAFWLGRRETKERIQEVLLVLHRLVTLQLSPTNLSGPPGILTAATHVASNGIPAMLIFLTMLSANLAVINFLPIPVLDGGHMMFLAAEWIRGRPVDAELQYKLTLAGLFFLLSLMVFASAMDVGRFLNF
jgi:regulator of sigma E protease